MDKINFLNGDNFPVYSEGLDILQNSVFMAGKCAFIGGDKYILSGCVNGGKDNITDGYIVVDGEIIPFVGGALKSKISIKETSQTIHAFGVNYREAYIFRVAQFSDNGDLKWSDFEPIPTNQQLHKQIVNITGDPAGIIKEWAGFIGKTPKDYMLCDGREMSVTEYPELFANIGTTFGGDGVDYFKIPNLSGRFSVGYGGNGDYSEQGKTGGKDKVILSESEMPRHRHKYSDDTNAQGKFPDVEPGFPQTFGGINTSQSSGSSSGSGTVYFTSHEGGKDGSTQSHENRPPYMVLAKIIKVR